MANKSNSPEIPVPKIWGKHVKSAIVHIIALAHHTMRAW